MTGGGPTGWKPVPLLQSWQRAILRIVIAQPGLTSQQIGDLYYPRGGGWVRKYAALHELVILARANLVQRHRDTWSPSFDGARRAGAGRGDEKAHMAEGRLMLVHPHARARLHERYGRTLTDAQWREVALAILAWVEGRPGAPALYLGTMRYSGAECWGVRIPGTEQWMRLVWSPDYSKVVTVLTPWRPETWERARRGQTDGLRNPPQFSALAWALRLATLRRAAGAPA